MYSQVALSPILCGAPMAQETVYCVQGNWWLVSVFPVNLYNNRHNNEKTSTDSSKEPGRKSPEAQSAAPSTSSRGSVSANGSASMKTNGNDAKKWYVQCCTYLAIRKKQISIMSVNRSRNYVPVGIGQESINAGTFLTGLLPIVLSQIRWKSVGGQSQS